MKKIQFAADILRAGSGSFCYPVKTQLETSLGKPEFMQAFESLKSLDRATVVAIANEFYGPVAPSSSKTKALGRIFCRHRKLMEFKGHTYSRSAA